MRHFIFWPTVCSVLFVGMASIALLILAISNGFTQFYFTDAYNPHDGSALNIAIHALFVTGVIGTLVGYMLAVHAERMYELSPWIVYVIALISAFTVAATLGVPGGNAAHGYVSTTATIFGLLFLLSRVVIGIRKDWSKYMMCRLDYSATQRLVSMIIFVVAFIFASITMVFYFFDSLVLFFSIFQLLMGGTIYLGVVIPLFFASFNEPRSKVI